MKVKIDDKKLANIIDIETDELIGQSHEECEIDRKSTRLNSSHQIISYAVFCLKKKKKEKKKKKNKKKNNRLSTNLDTEISSINKIHSCTV